MHNAAERLDGEYAAAVQEAHLAVAGMDNSSHEDRRITADKFRSLKARLSSGTANSDAVPGPASAIHIPDLLLKVRSARLARAIDVWAELEAQLPARSIVVEETPYEILAPSESVQNGVVSSPEPLFGTPTIEEPAEAGEASSVYAISATDEAISTPTLPEIATAELVEIEKPVAELTQENVLAESQEQPDQTEVTVVQSAAEGIQADAGEQDVSPSELPQEPQELYDSPSERLGSHVSILRKPTTVDDAFGESRMPQASVLALPNDPEPASFPSIASIDLEAKDLGASNPAVSPAAKDGETPEPANQAIETDPQAGEMARSLLDIMSAPSGATQPQERALAADMLLRLVPRIPLRPMIALVDRICIMEPPPPLLVARLIKDKRSEIAGPILERCTYIADQDLIEVIAEGDPAMQRMIARRRHLSAALSDRLVECGDPSVLLTLVRNPGAAISHDAFYRLCLHAKDHPSLQAPLTTRSDTPAPVAFELFWLLPVELRRYVLSRFLTDSETLNKLLKMASAVDANDSGDSSEAKFPEKNKVDRLVEIIEQNETTEAVALMEEIADVHEYTARRIIADADGEPLTVVFKAVGMTRAGFAEAIARIIASPHTRLRQDRNAADLQSIFDSLSFNKARVLLTYWDWASDETGNTVQS